MPTQRTPSCGSSWLTTELSRALSTGVPTNVGGFYLRSRVICHRGELCSGTTFPTVLYSVPKQQQTKKVAPTRTTALRAPRVPAHKSASHQPRPPIRTATIPLAHPSRGHEKEKKKKEHKHKGLLSGVGSMLGNAIEPGLGGALGATAGELLGNLFGWGDYEAVPPVNYPIENNTTLGLQTPMAAQIPMMHTEDGSTRIRKREYIGDVRMTKSFRGELYALNPASRRTFPWLSTVAANYEQYKFLGLSFGFRSLTANALGAVGDPAMGSITLFTQYDMYDATVTDKVAANNALYATSCKPSESMLHPVECDPEQTPTQPLYTGINEVISKDITKAPDRRLTYMGFTNVVTQGGPIDPGYLCGELWVTYDVMLYKPMVRLVNPNWPLMEDPVSVIDRYNQQLAASEEDTPPPDPTDRPPPLSLTRESTARSEYMMVDRR